MHPGGSALHSSGIDIEPSGTVETVLHSLVRSRIKHRVTQDAVTETFQQAAGQVVQAAEQLPRRAVALGGQTPIKAGVDSGVVFAFCHIFLATTMTTVTDVGYPLLVFTLWEGTIVGIVGSKGASCQRR